MKFLYKKKYNDLIAKHDSIVKQMQDEVRSLTEKHKKDLKSEYDRGYENGLKDNNKKLFLGPSDGGEIRVTPGDKELYQPISAGEYTKDLKH